ncbi:MAG: isochorismatase family protein [Legionellales bacterium]|nr:isochorismatase family protein [Legionellales bacterium]
MKNSLPENRASLDIDAQCTFTPLCPTELPVPEGNTIVGELNAQAQFADYRIGTKDAHSPNAIWVADEAHPIFTPIEGANVDVRWPLHAVPGTRGFELIEGLPPVTEYDFFVWKGMEPDLHPYGACYHDLADKMSTGLIEFLRQHNIQVVIAGGLATDLCVKVTVLQLLRAGFKVILNLGACRGISPDAIEKALGAMKDEGAIIIHSAAELPLIFK